MLLSDLSCFFLAPTGAQEVLFSMFTQSSYCLHIVIKLSSALRFSQLFLSALLALAELSLLVKEVLKGTQRVFKRHSKS